MVVLNNRISRTIGFCIESELAVKFKDKFNAAAVEMQLVPIVIVRPLCDGMVHVLAGARGDPYQLKSFWKIIFSVELDIGNQ